MKSTYSVLRSRRPDKNLHSFLNESFEDLIDVEDRAWALYQKDKLATHYFDVVLSTMTRCLEKVDRWTSY
ncbi:MAG: hypothetical protein ACE5KG_07490 [Nitrososphaerales archaeon]